MVRTALAYYVLSLLGLKVRLWRDHYKKFTLAGPGSENTFSYIGPKMIIRIIKNSLEMSVSQQEI